MASCCSEPSKNKTKVVSISKEPKNIFSKFLWKIGKAGEEKVTKQSAKKGCC